MTWTDLEIRQQLERYNSGEDEPPWQGAVPDMDKLNASIQVDQFGLWWGGSRCDICIYEAVECYLGVYYCRPHAEIFSREV